VILNVLVSDYVRTKWVLCKYWNCI